MHQREDGPDQSFGSAMIFVTTYVMSSIGARGKAQELCLQQCWSFAF